jgi:hypothetical protein
METARKLIWKREEAFNGWACNTCGWAYPVPRFMDAVTEPTEGARTEFDAHKCAKHPIKWKATQDFS